MNILIVYCHPSQNSYTFEILQQLKTVLNYKNWSITISDLYAMNFQSDLSEQEYEQQGLATANSSLPPDIIAEHEKIENADCIIFLYPVWWSDCPAKLKGWFDRVFTAGYAYGERRGITSMKTVHYALAVCTAGHSNEVLQQHGILASMEKIMLDDRFGKRFLHKQMILLGGTLEIDKVREQHKIQISSITEKIEKYCVA